MAKTAQLYLDLVNRIQKTIPARRKNGGGVNYDPAKFLD